jgi:uncharacterized membrane protein YgaE (UPF0421/DUF939 family)
MFIRKLFKIGDKLKWLSLELLVVFIGVYLAFLFNAYSENKKISAESEKVLTSLKKEAEEFRLRFPLFTQGMHANIQKWQAAYDSGNVAQYYDWRFLEPQYNDQVIEYAIGLKGSEIVDFELYETLLQLNREIKQLEHAERLMTETSNLFNNIPSDLSRNSDLYKAYKAQNLFHFYKFINYGRDRASNLKAVTQKSQIVVNLINQRISTEKRLAIEVDILKRFYPALDGDTTFIRKIFKESFPDFPEDRFEMELRKLIENK